MTEPVPPPLEPAPASPIPSSRPTLRGQWIFTGVMLGLLIVLGGIDAVRNPEGERDPLQCFLAFAFAFAHAMWVTMDSKRLGREVGWWRFAAILFGPIAIWAYLVSAYGRRSLVLIPLSLAVYAAWFLALLAVVVFVQLARG